MLLIAQIFKEILLKYYCCKFVHYIKFDCHYNFFEDFNIKKQKKKAHRHNNLFNQFNQNKFKKNLRDKLLNKFL